MHWFTLAIEFLGALLVLFIVAPLARLVLGVSSTEISAIIHDSELWESIALTFRCAVVAVVGGVVFGIPLAYFLARARFRGIALLQGIVDLPVMVPHSAAGIALLWGCLRLQRDALLGERKAGAVVEYEQAEGKFPL